MEQAKVHDNERQAMSTEGKASEGTATTAETMNASGNPDEVPRNSSAGEAISASGNAEDEVNNDSTIANASTNPDVATKTEGGNEGEKKETQKEPPRGILVVKEDPMMKRLNEELQKRLMEEEEPKKSRVHERLQENWEQRNKKRSYLTDSSHSGSQSGKVSRRVSREDLFSGSSGGESYSSGTPRIGRRGRRKIKGHRKDSESQHGKVSRSVSKDDLFPGSEGSDSFSSSGTPRIGKKGRRKDRRKDHLITRKGHGAESDDSSLSRRSNVSPRLSPDEYRPRSHIRRKKRETSRTRMARNFEDFRKGITIRRNQHRAAYEYYERKQAQYAIPAIIVSALATAFAAYGDGFREILTALTALNSVLIAVMNLQKFEQKAESHRMTAARFTSMAEDVASISFHRPNQDEYRVHLEKWTAQMNKAIDACQFVLPSWTTKKGMVPPTTWLDLMDACCPPKFFRSILLGRGKKTSTVHPKVHTRKARS